MFFAGLLAPYALHLADQVEAAFDERLAARSTELAELTATRRHLEREGDKLLAAHFADAIDLDTLKRHQDRIRAGTTDIDRRIADEYEQNQGPRKQLKKALRLLIDCATMYAATDDHGKRLANQTFINGIDITEDEQATPRLAEPYETTKSNPVRSSTTSEIVDGGGLQSHVFGQVKRLEALWELARRRLVPSASLSDSGLADAVTEPKRRSQTPLTANQIDAIQTARDSGESVMSIARRFEVSRMTVWDKTR